MSVEVEGRRGRRKEGWRNGEYGKNEGRREGRGGRKEERKEGSE